MTDKTDVLAAIEQVRAIWERRPEKIRHQPHVSQGRHAAVYALNAHVHAQADLVVPLLNHGWGNLTAPIVRAQLECAVMAQWLVHRGQDALLAFMAEGGRQRKTLVEELSEAGWERVTDEMVNRVRSEIPSGAELKDIARKTKQLWGELNGGDDLYHAYRVLSAYSHPGTSLVNDYMQLADDGSVVLRDQMLSLTELDGQDLLQTVAWSLVLATAAVDHVASGDSVQDELDTIAVNLGMPSAQLSLTDTVRTKIASAEPESTPQLPTSPQDR